MVALSCCTRDKACLAMFASRTEEILDGTTEDKWRAQHLALQADAFARASTKATGHDH